MYYLNTPGPYRHFKETIESSIYVDKTMLIDRITGNIRKDGKYVCITRPRRFGKTINANMLGAYLTKGYEGQELFDSLEIADTENYKKYLNRYNVIYIDFSKTPDICPDYQTYILNILNGIKEDLRQAYPQLAGKDYPMISRMFEDTGDSFIFILDEWDSIFYKKFVTMEDRNSYLGLLKNLFKDQTYADLVYMTGVLPIAKYSSGSELNMFDEYNFINDNIYDAFFGFTDEEVQKLCKDCKTVSYEEVKYWYDGYYTSDGRRLFNPRSVNRALCRGICLNYWTETGPMNEVADCIENNTDAVREDIVKMVAEIPVEAELAGYSAAELSLNTRDEILSAMVVYGFLAYHDGYLQIPNHELMEKFQRVLERDSMGELQKIAASSREMLRATLECREDVVAQILEEVHDREIPFLQYHDENSLSCVITLCYLYARKDYFVEREAKSGKGYCDYLFIPRKKKLPGIILELKVNAACEEAIRQIKERNYMERLKDTEEILLVGISYDRKKHHTCRIEKWHR